MNVCKFLKDSICFFPTQICPCCSATIRHTPLRVDISSEIDFYSNLKNYIKIRNTYLNDFYRKGECYCLKDCTLYELINVNTLENRIDISDNESFFKLKEIVISNRIYCNCNCIYCEQTENGKYRQEFNKIDIKYDIIDVLKFLEEQNLIDKGCKFTISGGEIAEYPREELLYIFNLARKFDGYLVLLSSGIKYSEEIACVLKDFKVNLCISVDSGTKEIYEKIKRVKAFDIVWQNIAKYVEISKENPNAVVEIKYIVIPGINDNINEAKKFIKKCRKVNCTNIRTEIEHYYMREHINEPFTKKLKQIFLYFEKTAKKNKINYLIEGVGRVVIERKLKENTVKRKNILELLINFFAK